MIGKCSRRDSDGMVMPRLYIGRKTEIAVLSQDSYFLFNCTPHN